MRNRLPIVYLVDSAGINLPYQDGIFPGPVRRGADFLLQLADAAEAASAADRGGDGHVHRRRRVSAGAVRRDHHGGGHQLHGAGRTEPGERRGGPSGRRRIAGRRVAAHATSAASRITRRKTMRIASRIIRQQIARICRRRARALAQGHRARRSPPKDCTICCPPIIACPTTWRK